MSPCKYVDCFKLRKGSIVSGITWSGVYILVYFDFGLGTSVWSDLVWSVSCGLVWSGLIWSGPHALVCILWSGLVLSGPCVLVCVLWSGSYVVWSICPGLCTLVWVICGLVHMWSGPYTLVWSDLIWYSLLFSVCLIQSSHILSPCPLALHSFWCIFLTLFSS